MDAFPHYWPFVQVNSPITDEFPSQRPVTRGFDVFFDLRLNKQLSKQWRRRGFETPARPLWRLSKVMNQAYHSQPRVLANVCWVHFGQNHLVATPRWGNHGPETPRWYSPNVFTLLYPVQSETLTVIFWNIYLSLKCYIEKQIDVSQLYQIICCSVLHT